MVDDIRRPSARARGRGDRVRAGERARRDHLRTGAQQAVSGDGRTRERDVPGKRPRGRGRVQKSRDSEKVEHAARRRRASIRDDVGWMSRAVPADGEAHRVHRSGDRRRGQRLGNRRIDGEN